MTETLIREFIPGPIDRNYVQCLPSTKACPGMVTVADRSLIEFSNSQSENVLRSYRDWISSKLSRFSGPPNMELRTLYDEEIESNADYFGVLIGIPMPDSNNSGNIFMVRRLGFTNSPIIQDQDTLTEDVHKVFQSLALHEVDEWLRFDGSHVVDPHPDL